MKPFLFTLITNIFVDFLNKLNKYIVQLFYLCQRSINRKENKQFQHFLNSGFLFYTISLHNLGSLIVIIDSKNPLLGLRDGPFRNLLSCLVWPKLIPPLDVWLHQKYCIIIEILKILDNKLSGLTFTTWKRKK